MYLNAFCAFCVFCDLLRSLFLCVCVRQAKVCAAPEAPQSEISIEDYGIMRIAGKQLEEGRTLSDVLQKSRDACVPDLKPKALR